MTKNKPTIYTLPNMTHLVFQTRQSAADTDLHDTPTTLTAAGGHLAHLELTLAHLVLIEEHTWRPATAVCSDTASLMNQQSFE